MDRRPVRRFRPDAGAPRPPDDVWPVTVPAVAQLLRELTASWRAFLTAPESYLRHLR